MFELRFLSLFMLFACTALPRADPGPRGDDNFLQWVQVTQGDVALV